MIDIIVQIFLSVEIVQIYRNTLKNIEAPSDAKYNTLDLLRCEHMLNIAQYLGEYRDTKQ